MLVAADTRLQMLQGSKFAFNAEAEGQFATVPELMHLANYDAIFRKPTLKPEKVDSYFNPRRFYSLFKKTK